MTNYIKTGNRINYIDALRGFSMLLIVIGHVMLYSFDLGGYNTVLGSIILTFRMPMFFFISGYIAYKVSEMWNVRFYLNNVKKKALIQIIPTIFFFVLFALCYGGNPFGFLSHGFDRFWFTFVLFEMFAIYYTIALISHYTSRHFTDIGLISLSVIGILVLIFFRDESQLWNVLCLENLTKYFQFFAFGIICRKHNAKFSQTINNQPFRGGCILSFIICMLLYFNTDFESSYPLIYKGIHDIIVRYSGLLVIYIFFLHYHDYFDKQTKFNNWLLFVGRRTLDIYLLHYFFLPNLQFLKPYLEPTNMMLIQLIMAITISIAIVILSLFISNIIRTSDILAKYLFGVKTIQ